MIIGQTSALKRSHTLLFMGQSNCGGYNSPIVDPTIYPALSGQYIFEPISQTWQKLQKGLNNSGSPFAFPGHFGAEMAIMQRLYDYYGTDQYMIKYAIGGTSLATGTSSIYNWSPASTDAYCFKGAVDNYHAAMNSFPAYKLPPKVFIWWQGEDDTGSSESLAYGVNFNNFIYQFKNQCDLDGLVVIQVGLSNNQITYPSIGITNVNNAKIAYSINGNKFISTDGASVQGDGVHFSSAGYEDIAQRVFDVLITML